MTRAIEKLMQRDDESEKRNAGPLNECKTPRIWERMERSPGSAKISMIVKLIDTNAPASKQT